MGSPTQIPASISPRTVLTKERAASKSIALQVQQNSPPTDIAPGPAVAVAADPTELGRALMAADPPPPAFQTILEAQMFP